MSKIKSSIHFQKVALAIALLGLGALFLYTIKDYLQLMILAYFTVIIAEPIYLWILRRSRQKYIAATITMMLLFILVIIPAYVVLSIISSQLAYILEQMNSGKINIAGSINSFADITALISKELQALIIENKEQMEGSIKDGIATIANLSINFVFPIIGATFNVFIRLLTYLILTILLFPKLNEIHAFLFEVSPYSSRIHKRFMDQLTGIAKGTVYSSIALIGIQGFMTWFILWILQVPGAVTWSVLISLVVLIPFAAGFLVTLIALFLFFNGFWLKGIILILWANLVIGAVDNLVRAKIFNRTEAHLPEIISIISILGGLQVYGFVGLLYGPIIASLFYASLVVYKEEKNRK